MGQSDEKTCFTPGDPNTVPPRQEIISILNHFVDKENKKNGIGILSPPIDKSFFPSPREKKKVLLLFEYACHPCTGTMLIFSVYLSVCLMSQPEGWTTYMEKLKYINIKFGERDPALELVCIVEEHVNMGQS